MRLPFETTYSPQKAFIYSLKGLFRLLQTSPFNIRCFWTAFVFEDNLNSCWQMALSKISHLSVQNGLL